MKDLLNLAWRKAVLFDMLAVALIPHQLLDSNLLGLDHLSSVSLRDADCNGKCGAARP